MNNTPQPVSFTHSILTALFAGIVASLSCLVYDQVYRNITGFSLSEMINVSTIIFGTNILLLICGLVYYAFRKSGRAGEIMYIIVLSLLVVFLIWKAQGVVRSDVHEDTVQFRGLLTGMITIMGVCAAFLIPFLFHNKGFHKHVI